ncbi:hypothetical protein VR010_06855 [Actinomycetaceae bacterium L2_0104]
MSVLLCVSGDLEVQIVEGLARLDPAVPVLRRCADMIELIACAQAGIGEIAVVDDIDVTTASELHGRGLRIVGVMQRMDPGAGRHVGCDAIASPFADDVVACVLNLQEMRILRPDNDGSDEKERFGRSAPGGRQSQVRSEALEVRSRSDDGEFASFPGTPPRGKIIAVWGSVGSPGRSTVARELACALGVNAPTLLIDADVHAPSLAQLLGLDQETSAIVAVARAINMGEDDAAVVRRASIPLAGIDFLPGLNTGRRWREIPRPVADKLWDIVRAGWECIVVDCAAEVEVQEYGFEMERDGVTLSLLETADEVIVVGQAGPLGLRRLIDQLDHADGLGIAKPQIVVTKTGHRQMNGSAEIAAVLAESGRQNAFCIREDGENLTRAENQGAALREISPGCACAKDIAALAARLEGTSAGSRAQERGRPRSSSERPPGRPMRMRAQRWRGWLTKRLARGRFAPRSKLPSQAGGTWTNEDAMGTCEEGAVGASDEKLGSFEKAEESDRRTMRRADSEAGNQSGGEPSGRLPGDAAGCGDTDGEGVGSTRRNGRHRRPL